MINPRYKEAMQRGFPMRGDSVVMPDGTVCHIDDFNLGLCGLTWQTQDYCVPEGRYVWDENKCCPGLVAYLPEGEDGQATCQKAGTVKWLHFLSNPLVWAVGGLLVGAGIFGFVRMRRGVKR